LIVVILVGVLLHGMDWNGFHFDWDLGDDAQIVTGTASVEPSSIKHIRIEWIDGTVEIRGADQEHITFSETNGEKECMVYAFKGDTLVIRYSKDSIKLGINITTPNKHLTVHVPMDWIAEGIEISAVSSNVTVELPEVQETKIETVSGNIDIRYERSKEISFSTVSGHAGFTGNCEELDCESVSGNCKVALWGNAKEIQMESISGDLEITLDDQFGFTAQLDSVSGRISSDFSANVSDQTHTYGDGSIRIEAETVSGGIRIRKT
jgi:DUF4097 and DUF4098 domain-containing protein YvlB